MNRRALVLALALAGAGGACGDKATTSVGPRADMDDQEVDASLAFHLEAPTKPEFRRAPDLAKVKNLLVGLPLTDEEVKAVTSNPKTIGSLIERWMTLPEYRSKMLTFFQLAFQQTQIGSSDLNPQAYPYYAAANHTTAPLLAQNVRESFARTMLQLVTEGRPFTEAMTTQRFMMTPALMEFYAFLDSWQVDNAGQVRDRFQESHPNVRVVVEASEGPIPLGETLDPSSPNFMRWYNPDVAKSGSINPACATDPLVYPARHGGFALHVLLHGSLHNWSPVCPRIDGSPTSAQLGAADYDNWKMVTVRPPRGSEPTTAFYDLPRLRTTNELVVRTPRVGFFSTPAFFANWPTNASNQMRVTANQTLIVATGTSIDGTDDTVPPSEPGLDAVHAGEPACFSCHKTMDPTRSILSATFSWYYHPQTDPIFANEKGLFAFQGVTAPVRSIADLGGTLARHPLLGPAWVQKLCYYANSAECRESDLAFKRVVRAFESSGYSWNVLVREFFSSPLTTNEDVQLAPGEPGPVIAVSRRDHLCAALNARLGFEDICGTSALAKPSTIGTIAAGLPSDGYARGSVAPVLANQPTLFYRAATESICKAAAVETIDAVSPRPGVKRWSSTAPDAAITDFVRILLGFPPSDPRAARAEAVLKSHFDEASLAGAQPADALKSTFVAACLSPSFVAIGF